MAEDVKGPGFPVTRDTILVGLALILLSWMLDAALDTAFGDDTFFSEMFHPDLNEIAIRLLFMGTQLFYVLYIARILQKYRLQGVLLEEALQRRDQLVSMLATANKDLEAFNYTVAHDLRQPLNILASCCQIIEKMLEAQSLDECKGYVRDAYKATLKMNGLIEALLKFSRMGLVEPRREEVELSMLAHEVAHSLITAEPERQVDFVIADGVMANGDPNLLRVILENLIGNAWKYTGMRERAVIEFGVTDVHGVPTYFVRDNGAGFEMAAAKQVFIPFKRLPGAEMYKGFGIGLATVQRIIQRHGGRIWTEGVPGKGATFYFTLSEDQCD